MSEIERLKYENCALRRVISKSGLTTIFCSVDYHHLDESGPFPASADVQNHPSDVPFSPCHECVTTVY